MVVWACLCVGGASENFFIEDALYEFTFWFWLFLTIVNWPASGTSLGRFRNPVHLIIIIIIIIIITRNTFYELGVCPKQLFRFWSRDVHPVRNLLLCTKCHENPMISHWDMAIYRFLKWRPSAILELFITIRAHPRSLCCWPQLLVKFHVNLIHRFEDIAIWIFRIFGLKFLLFRPPKWGF